MPTDPVTFTQEPTDPNIKAIPQITEQQHPDVHGRRSPGPGTETRGVGIGGHA